MHAYGRHAYRMVSVRNTPMRDAPKGFWESRPLPHRRRRTRPHLPSPGPSPGIKTHSSTADFPATLSLPFVPSLFTFPAPPPPVVPQAAPSSTYSLRHLSSPQNRYDVASGKNAAARPAGSYSLDALCSTASSTNLGISNVVALQLLWHHNFVGNLGISNVVTSQLLWLIVFALCIVCLVVTRVPLPAHESSLSQFNTTILTPRP
jgi:hypothetical protein